MAMIQLGVHLVELLGRLKDRQIKRVRIMLIQIKNDSLKLWDSLETFLEDHLKTFHTLLKDRIKRILLLIILFEKCVIFHYSNQQQDIGQNLRNRIMTHKCIKVSLRKDSNQIKWRLESHPSIQLDQVVHHQFTEGQLAQMIDSIRVYKYLNIKDTKSLLTYLLTQHCQLLVLQWASSICRKIRPQDVIISSFRIRLRNLVKDSAL